MIRTQIQAMQDRIGTTPDGFWGPKSIAACQKHLRSLMPSPNPWPKTDQSSLTKFYGAPGDESRLVNLDVHTLCIAYDGKPVRTIRCHERVADSLRRVLEEIAAGPHAPILTEYAGVYNNRPMRGGNLPSLHARGAAIDLAPDTNRLSQAWPKSADMPLEVMEAFAREGWKSAGAFWGYDGMHHEATS